MFHGQFPSTDTFGRSGGVRDYFFKHSPAFHHAGYGGLGDVRVEARASRSRERELLEDPPRPATVPARRAWSGSLVCVDVLAKLKRNRSTRASALSS